MTPTSPITTHRKIKTALDAAADASAGAVSFRKRSGFTLMEILLVAALIGLMASMALPKNIFSFNTPLRSMQRAVAEITDMTLSGRSVRLRADTTEARDRGPIVVEALTKIESESDPAKSALEWLPVQIANQPEGRDWMLEPEVIYFYSDGTCTPGVVRRADKGTRITEGDMAMLTVTGFLFEPQTD